MEFQKKQAGSWSDIPYYLYLDRVETFTQFPALIPASAATGGHLTFWTLSGNGQQISPNLVDPSATVPGYQESNGNIHAPSSGNERTTDWIPFTTDALYAIVSGSSGGNINWVLYDSNKQPLHFKGPTFTPNTVITISREGYSAAAFIRISWTNAANQPICVTYQQTATFIGFTPAPDNPIQPEFVGKLVGADWTIPITCAEQTITVNLGQTQTVRRIKKVVFTGQETWTEVYPGEPEAQAQGIVMYATSLSEIGTDRNDFRCSHFFVGNYRGYLISGQGRINGTATSAVPEAFTVNYSNGSGGLQNFKAWLASEYAAGHPVTLWYALATEQTSIVNEPLAKICDYADTVGSTNTGAPQIPLLAGSDNIITFGTELPPSEFQAGFVSWHSVQNVHLRSGGQWS